MSVTGVWKLPLRGGVALSFREIEIGGVGKGWAARGKFTKAA